MVVLIMTMAVKLYIKNYFPVNGSRLNSSLIDYYRGDSVLMFQGEKFQGVDAIIAFFTCFSFLQWKPNSLIKMTPTRLVRNDNRVQRTSISVEIGISETAMQCWGGIFRGSPDDQTLHLKPTPKGSFYVLNDILRSHRELDPIVSSSGVEDQIAAEEVQKTLPSPFSN